MCYDEVAAEGEEGEEDGAAVDEENQKDAEWDSYKVDLNVWQLQFV